MKELEPSVKCNIANGWNYQNYPDSMREVIVIWIPKKHPGYPRQCCTAIFDRLSKQWVYQIVTANKEEKSTSVWGYRCSVDRQVICWTDIPKYISDGDESRWESGQQKILRG